jgi:hypothetical protein
LLTRVATSKENTPLACGSTMVPQWQALGSPMIIPRTSKAAHREKALKTDKVVTTRTWSARCSRGGATSGVCLSTATCCTDPAPADCAADIRRDRTLPPGSSRDFVWATCEDDPVVRRWIMHEVCFECVLPNRSIEACASACALARVSIRLSFFESFFLWVLDNCWKTSEGKRSFPIWYVSHSSRKTAVSVQGAQR